MKIAKFLLLISPTILALLLLAAHWFSKNEQASEAEREAPIHKAFAIAVKDGVTTLAVDQASQTRSGIQTAALADAPVAHGPVVFGTVVDLQPLFELSSRYAAASAERHAAQAEAGQKEAELKRVQALYDDGQNLSRKALDAARADMAASQARTSAAANASAAAATALRQQFGPAVAAWAIAPKSPELAALMNRKAVLVRMVFLSPGEPPQRLALSGDAQVPVEARLVSASPQVDAGMQGQAWLYRADAPLAAGARLAGRAAGQAQSGLRIPPEAIVWYGGQSWAYVRTSSTGFERRPLDRGIPVDGDFIALQGFARGEAVVVRGAQLLLSEESRALLGKD